MEGHGGRNESVCFVSWEKNKFKEVFRKRLLFLSKK